MKRPYVCFSGTLIISLLVFCAAGFNSAVAVAIAALFFAVLFFFLRNKNNVFNCIFVVCLSLIIASSSFITKTATDYKPALLLVSDNEVKISGTLYDYREEYDRHYYTLDNVSVNGIPSDHKIRIASDIYRNTDIDDIFTVENAVIYELGASSGNQDSYKADDIFLGAYAEGNFQITSAETHSARYYATLVRDHISCVTQENIKNEYASVANAMLTGDTSDMDAEILLYFRYSGIAHLFAVSGFHLSLWTGMLAYALNNLIKKNRFITPIACILFTIVFMAVTGFTKSVLRAGIMIIIFFIGIMINYRADPLNSLFIAVSVILLVNPFAVMSISLQMSFLATLGILIFSRPVTKSISKLKEKLQNKFLYKSLSSAYVTVMISVTASLFTMPVSAINFGYISVAAPITNLICSFPAQGLILISGLNVIANKIPFISDILASICTFLTKLIVTVTKQIASADNALMDTTSADIQILLTAIVVLMTAFLIIFRKSDKRLFQTLLGTSAVFALITACILSAQSSGVKITVADVGNGTSVMLHTEDSYVIIGCGGNTYKSYRLMNIADRSPMRTIDLMVIPRNTQTESEYAYKMLRQYKLSNSIISSDGYPKYLTELLPENTTVTDNCTVRIDDKTTLTYRNTDDFSGLRIESDIFTCTILFRALSSFSSVPENWTQGSLLITRQSLPDIDISRFANIIVSSSKEIIYDNPNIYTTAYSGQLDYRMYSTGTAVVSEEKHDYK